MVEVAIGDRVLVDGKLGIVRYAGVTEFCDGWWYGIELEECVGINDGSVRGKRYFDLQEKQGDYGIFAQLENIRKIDDGGALREENRKLLSVVEALERKIRLWRLKPEQSGDGKIVKGLQDTVKDWEVRYVSLGEQMSNVQQENRVLENEVKNLREKVTVLSTATGGMGNTLGPGSREPEGESPPDRQSVDAEPKSEAAEKDFQMLIERNTELAREVEVLREESKQYESMLSVCAEIEEELRYQLRELERVFDEHKIWDGIGSLNIVESRHTTEAESNQC